MSIIGLILQLAYRLRRHFWLGWSLARWWGLLLVVVGLWAVIRWWPYPWPAVVPGGLLLALVAILAWAGRQGYVRFENTPAAQSLLQETPSPPPLRCQELVPIRASGWFTVEGEDQYYVDLEADFETVGTREHIVLGHVHPSRFLLFGRWPKHELCWWYIFFQPAMIQQMDVGHLHFGSRPHLALRVVHAPDGQTRQSVHFTFEDAVALRRVWDDLLLDVPASVAVSGDKARPRS